MPYALCTLGWLGLGCFACWVHSIIRLPGDRQLMVHRVRWALWDHYSVSDFPVEKWGGCA